MEIEKRSCNCPGWTRECLLPFKNQFEIVLKKSFSDEYFLKNISILFACYQYKQTKSMLKDDNRQQSQNMVDIYSDEIDMIPIKIDYFQLNAKFNNNFRNVHCSKCSHFEPMPDIDTISDFSEAEAYVVMLYTNGGCCKQCAILLTPIFVSICYAYQTRHLPCDIGRLCFLCGFLAALLQHKYIKYYLKTNVKLYPIILKILYDLSNSAHDLYNTDFETYLVKRNTIYFAIWSLLKQIVINYKYLNKYYYTSEIHHHSECHICAMIKWLMGEVKIIGDDRLILHKNGGTLMRCEAEMSFEFDIFGVMIILTTLSANECMETMEVMTNRKIGVPMQFLLPIFAIAHKMTHNPKSIGNFFKQSLRKISKIKRDMNKCQWSNCKTMNCKKYYQCKNCKIAKYCGKKCQKLDWNKGNHRRACSI